MNKEKDPLEMTIKEFMKWYEDQYDGSTNPEHFNEARTFISGFALGYAPDNPDFQLAVIRLADARNFFKVVKRYSK